MQKERTEKQRWLLASLAVLALLFAVGISTSGALAGVPTSTKPKAGSEAPRIGAVTTTSATKSDTSPPLRSIPPQPARPGQVDNDNDRLPNRGKGDYVKDTVVQSVLAPAVIPSPIISFDGMYNQYGPIPPDTNGDVGRTQYVQLVNSGIQVFNKTSGASVFGPVNLNTIWYGFGGFCETYNNGDPVVLYDSLADRWLLSQFAFASQSGPTHQCIAISTGPDAAGSYYRYDFISTTIGFDDYPHYGVWPDAYYMTANRFSGPNGFAGANVAYERPRMLVGDPAARLVQFEVIGDGGALPADFDGLTPPPAGSPEFFWYPSDPSTGLINEYKFHVDFNTPANSTFTGPFAINVAPWDDNLCAASRQRCIPQPGTTAQLEAIADRFMFRLAYRNYGTHESMTVAHTVDSNGSGIAGTRWYEVRDPNGARTVFQQGTYAPGDGTHRWMGSAAMDRMGDLAIGFSASSTTVFPSPRYAGRLVTDPLGQLSQGEATLFAASGSEDFPAAPRWGDYSALTVDPVDDCTFYYTTEYFAQTGLRNWRTRIGSFRFPSCTSGGATPVVTSTPGPSLTPLPPTATPCAGGATYTGSITMADPTQVGRLGVGSPPSSCAAPLPAPNFSDQLTRHYDQYTYTNNSGSTQCVTVYVTQACGDNAAQSVAYLGSFDPANLTTNYLAHGGAAGPSYQYSFSLAAGQTAVVVMLEVSPNIGCATYSLSIGPCAQGTPTSTPIATPSSTPTSGPSVTPTSCVPNYVASTAVATIIPGGTDIGNSCDDCDTQINLPFPVTVYGRTYMTASISSNGNIQFASNNPNIYDVHCLPVAGSGVNPPFASTLFAYYDDLRTDIRTTCPTCGIFTQTLGTAPNRQFVIRWHTTFYGSNADEAEFEVVLTEGSTRLSVIYGASANSGLTASSGTQFNTTTATQYSCTTADLTAGLRVNYDPTGCGGPTATVAPPTSTATRTAVPTSTVCAISFSDVPTTHPFYSFIRCLACRNIISGYSDGTFKPGNDITRSQIAKMVSNAAGFSEGAGAQIYEDVPPENVFYPFINRLSRRGIMGGYPCGTVPEEPCIMPDNRPYFRPFANATRGQLAKIVSNAAGLSGTPTGIFYTDVQLDNPFYVWIMRLTTLGVMSGYPCGTIPEEPCDEANRPYFRPFNNVTRGQASKIVANTFYPSCITPSR